MRECAYSIPQVARSSTMCGVGYAEHVLRCPPPTRSGPGLAVIVCEEQAVPARKPAGAGDLPNYMCVAVCSWPFALVRRQETWERAWSRCTRHPPPPPLPPMHSWGAPRPTCQQAPRPQQCVGGCVPAAGGRASQQADDPRPSGLVWRCALQSERDPLTVTSTQRASSQHPEGKLPRSGLTDTRVPCGAPAA